MQINIGETRKECRELQERWKELCEEARKVADAHKDDGRDAMNAEEQEKFDKLMAEAKQCRENHDRLKKLDNEACAKFLATQARERLDHADPEGKERRLVADRGMSSWVLRGPRGVSPDQVRAVKDEYGHDVTSSEIALRFQNHSNGPIGPTGRPRTLEALEKRLDTGASTGGDMISQGFLSSVQIALLAFGGMRQARTTVINTASGNDLKIPTVDDTSNTGELVAEKGTLNAQDIATGNITLNAYKYSSKIVKVSSEFLQDEEVGAMSLLGSLLGERIGRITNTHFTTGSGTSQPNGVVTAATLGVTAAANNAITYGELVDTKHSVDPAWRAGAEWMMNDSTWSTIIKLADTGGRPLFHNENAFDDTSLSILGHRIIINQDVASIGSATKVILFGDFSRYWIRDVAPIVLKRSDDAYWTTDEIGFVALSRHDGDLSSGGTPIKFLQMAV